MRDVKRIRPVMARITDLWKSYCPDWRFGQLMMNFSAWYGDVFYLEDIELVDKMEEYLIFTFGKRE